MTSKPVFATTLLTLAFATAPPARAQEGPQLFDQGRALPAPGAVLPWRERAAPVNEMLEERLRDLLPRLMREAGIDLWLVINREYAEDPVFLTLVPEPVFAARRTTMLAFHDLGTGEPVGTGAWSCCRSPATRRGRPTKPPGRGATRRRSGGGSPKSSGSGTPGGSGSTSRAIGRWRTG
jgi:hypothetical protein